MVPNKFKKLYHIMCLAFCISVVCFALAGNAWAVGTTRLLSTATLPSTYASEATINPVGGATPGNTYTMTTAGNFNSDVYRDMTVARSNAQGFLVVLTLQNGAVFAAPLPTVTDLAITNVGTGTFGITFPVGGAPVVGGTTITWMVDVTADFTLFPTLQIKAGSSNWKIRDVTNRLATGAIQAAVQTYDANTGNTVDEPYTGLNPQPPASNDLVDIARPSPALIIPITGGAAAGVFTATTAVVDVATLRKNFVATAPDTTTVDNGASVGIYYTNPTPLKYDGTVYAISGTDKITFTFTDTANFAGLLAAPATVTWGAQAMATSNKTIVLTPATFATLTNSQQFFTFAVDGTTALATRTLAVKIDINLGANQSTPGGAATKTILAAGTTVSTWSANGTVLIASFANANTNIFASRIYLYNSSSLTGDVSARVLKMPLVGSGTPVTSGVLVATTSLGSLAAQSGMNIKLKEDLLTPAAVTLPYTENGGNVVVEITITTYGAKGSFQVFRTDGTVVFGLADLQQVAP
jgi:hypothetical protein